MTCLRLIVMFLKLMRAIGAHLPLGFSEISPADLFKLYFDMDLVQNICDATNEYELQKKNHPTMYQYFKHVVPDDFCVLVGIFVHLGYHRIPHYRLMSIS